MVPQLGLKTQLHLLSLFLLFSLRLPPHNPKLELISVISKTQHSMVGPSKPPKATIKFLCSYGGKILPRYPDGKLRYLGGQTRVLSVDRSISFSELLVKLGELCGSAAVTLRCQLPTEDLDALVSITSDEDLANLIEEYDLVASLKIRAFLSPPKSLKKKLSIPSSLSLSNSSLSSSSSTSSSSSHSSTAGGCGCSTFGCSPRNSVMVPTIMDRCVHQMSAPMVYPNGMKKFVRRKLPLPHYAYPAQRNPGHICLIHNGNHWQ